MRGGIPMSDKKLKEIISVVWVELCRNIINNSGGSLHLSEGDFRTFEKAIIAKDLVLGLERKL